MSAENSSSKGSTLVKAVLVLLLSLLSFSVGTFVGKNVSDSDHRKMALEGDYKGAREVASVSDRGDAADHEEKISEKEVESLTEEFVNKEKVGTEVAANEEAEHTNEAAHGAVANHAAPVKNEAGGYKSYARGAKEESKEVAAHTEDAHAVKAEHKAADATNKVANKVAAGAAPSDGKAEERKPASTLPSVASTAIGKYTLQVGSYTEESEAKNHAATLKGKGWQAFYLPVTINNRQWYRVLVGLFENSKSAQEFRAQYMKEANTKSAIVQKIVQ